MVASRSLSSCARFIPAASEFVIIRSETRFSRNTAPASAREAAFGHVAPWQTQTNAAAAASDLLFSQPSGTYCSAAQTAPIPIAPSASLHPKAAYLPPVNCKLRLLPNQLPLELRNRNRHRFSALYNATGEPFLMSQSLAQGTVGKLRVVRDTHGAYWAVKCFRTDALPVKEGISKHGHPTRTAWSRQRIFAEAQTIRAASPDMQVRDVIETPGKIYIVLTLGQGELAAMFSQIPASVKVNAAHLAMHAMASKLQILHANGFVHADTKVHNALFSYGDVMLCDYGTTRPLEADGRIAFSLSSTYPSPEQARGHRFGIANDIWSLGASFGDLFRFNDCNIMGHDHTFEASAAHLKQFTQWRDTLFDVHGRFCKERLMTDSTSWGEYFRPRMQVDDYGTTVVLVRMLEPNATKRASASQVAAAFYPYTPQRQFDYDEAVQALDEVASGSKVMRTVRQIENIFNFNQHNSALHYSRRLF